MIDHILDALAQLPAYLTLCCRSGRIVWSNTFDHGCNADLIGQPADSTVSAPDRPLWWSAFYRARDCREVVPYAISCDVPEPPYLLRLAGVLSPVVRDRAVVMVAAMCRDVTHALPCPVAPALPPPVRPPEIPEGALWLSPLGEAIVRFLLPRRPGWTTCEVIATAIGETPGHRFRASLTGLVDRRILEASTGAGYRLRA